MASLILSALVACTLIAGSSAAVSLDFAAAGLSVAGLVPVPAPAPAPIQSRSSVTGRKLAGHTMEAAAGRKLSQVVDASNPLVDTSGLGLPNPVTGLVDALPVDASVDASGLPVVKDLPKLADVNAAQLGLAGYVPAPAPAPVPAPARG